MLPLCYATTSICSLLFISRFTRSRTGSAWWPTPLQRRGPGERELHLQELTSGGSVVVVHQRREGGRRSAEDLPGNDQHGGSQDLQAWAHLQGKKTTILTRGTLVFFLLSQSLITVLQDLFQANYS